MRSPRLAVAAIAVLLACSDDSAIGPGPVAEVVINPSPLTVDLGLGAQLQALPLDADHALLADKLDEISWTSSNPAVATVGADGSVNSLALGVTTISATVDGVAGTADVTVSLPGIGLAPGALGFSAVEGAASPAAQTVAVTSQRGGTLSGLTVGPISYGAGATGWLSASLDATTVPATLTLTPATGGIVAGSYTAQVPVGAAGASNSPQSVVVTLTVDPGPAIALSVTSLDFAAAPGGAAPAPQTVDITNGGGGTLSGLAVGTISYGPGASNWISSASLDQATAPATLAVQASPAGLAQGSYTATVPVTATNGSNSPQNVTVNFVITNQATIVLSAPSATFSAAHLAGNPAPAQITITNGSGGTLSGLALNVSYGPGASGWLTAGLDQATAPATLTLTPATGSLAVGSYTATVAVSSPTATNSPVNVSVTFTIIPSLANDVQPIFTASCAGCHFAGAGGIPPDLRSGFMRAATVGVTSSCNGLVYVVTGNAAQSYLHQKVASATPACNQQMPPGGPFLTAGQLQIIADWINAGAPDN